VRHQESSDRPVADLLVTGAAELLTCRADASDDIGLVTNGAVAVAAGTVIAAGPTAEVLAAVDTSRATIIGATGRVVLPGFVDCHTHVVFGGSRVDEYTIKLTGGDVAPLRARGVPVGITGTMAATAALSIDNLIAETRPRLQEMLAAGTTTVESKSGYALTTTGELAMLEANRRLHAEGPWEIVSTFLGAHAFPPGVPRARFVDEIVSEMIPRVATEKLAVFCDVFCEDGYFTPAETDRVLRAGLDHGLRPKLHLDQYSETGAAGIAASLGCVSVDHLNHTPPAGLDRLAAAGVVAVPLPALDFAVAHRRPVDIRRILDHGLEIGLATDICPGCWLPSMQLVIALACRLHAISPAEAIRTATLGAARALALGDRIGSLEPGKQADLLVLDVDRHEDLAYKIGRNAVDLVIKRGAIVVDRRRDSA
jgi:imidazolonepropionase